MEFQLCKGRGPQLLANTQVCLRSGCFANSAAIRKCQQSLGLEQNNQSNIQFKKLEAKTEQCF